MSIISFKNNFIFLKTRKTAGTSIQASLKGICGKEDIVTYGWINEITGEKSVLSEFFAKDDIVKELNIDFDSFLRLDLLEILLIWFYPGICFKLKENG
jgi:hypothetical protein